MKDMFETAIIHIIGGINWIVFQATRGRVVLYRFGGMPGLSLTIAGRRTADSITFLVPYLLDGEDFIVFADSETESYPEWAINLFNAELARIVTVEICDQYFDVTALKINEEYRAEILRRLLAEASLSQRHEVRRRRQFPLARLVKITSSVE